MTFSATLGNQVGLAERVRQTLPRRGLAIAGLAIAITVFLMRFLFLQDKPPAEVFVDYFHTGEWFLAEINTRAGVAFDTLTIHGGKDILPAMAARLIFGDELYVGAMPLVYQFGITLPAALLLIYTMWRMAPSAQMAMFLIPVAAWLSVAVNYRDAGIILLLAAYFGLLARADRPTVLRLALFSAAATFSILYSMNRGAVTIVSVTAITVWLGYADRRYLTIIPMVGAMWIAAGLWHPLFTPSHVIKNILFLVETSHIHRFHVGEFEEPWLHTWTKAFLLVTGLAALGLNIVRYRAGPRNRRDVASLILLACLMAGYFELSTDRRFEWYFPFGTLMLFPTLAHWWSLKARQETPVTRTEAFLFAIVIVAAFGTLRVIFLFDTWFWYEWTVLTCGLLVFAVMGILDVRERSVTLRAGALALAGFGMLVILTPTVNAFSNALRNGKIAEVLDPAGIVEVSTNPDEHLTWVVDAIKDADPACLFDASNSGLINAYTQLPTCTRFSMLFYAIDRHEDEMIAALKKADPPIIVYWSAHWWTTQDMFPISDRFERLDQVMTELYPVEVCSEIFCVRYKSHAQIGLDDGLPADWL